MDEFTMRKSTTSTHAFRKRTNIQFFESMLKVLTLDFCHI